MIHDNNYVVASDSGHNINSKPVYRHAVWVLKVATTLQTAV